MISTGNNNECKLNYPTAAEIMKSSLISLGEEYYIRYMQHSLFHNWNRIAGKFADNVKPVNFEHKILFVNVSSAIWKTELQFDKETLIKAINDYVDRALIEDIRLTQKQKPIRKPIKIDPSELSPDEVVRQLMPTIQLTPEENAEIEEAVKDYEDSDFREMIRQNMVARRRLEKCRLKAGWMPCYKCGQLISPDMLMCRTCYRKEKEKLRALIRRILLDVPWIGFADIQKEIAVKMPHMISQCIPETVNSERAALVQKLASTLDQDNDAQVKHLVMIYRQLRPNELNDGVIARVMRRMRFDIPNQERD